MKTYLRLLALVAVFVLAPSSVHAQTTASQTYTVVVPTSVSITAPAAASLTHDETNNPQAFPAQTWVVRGNSRTGMNISFASDSFTHTTDPTFKRNSRLNLTVGTTQGPASWTVGVPASTSSFLTSTPATVTATSTGVGRANLNLVVSFLTEEYGTFASGSYIATVVGTVAANP
jgi:hypothetical protein